jgi:molybdopterin-biosynthesis enzyme MoeA-like protein
VPFLLRDLVEAMAPEFAGSPLVREELRTDLREGQIADDLTSAQAASLDVAIGSYPAVAADGRWWTRIVLRGQDPARVAEVAGALRVVLARRAEPGPTEARAE